MEPTSPFLVSPSRYPDGGTIKLPDTPQSRMLIEDWKRQRARRVSTQHNLFTSTSTSTPPSSSSVPGQPPLPNQPPLTFSLLPGQPPLPNQPPLTFSLLLLLLQSNCLPTWSMFRLLPTFRMLPNRRCSISISRTKSSRVRVELNTHLVNKFSPAVWHSPT